MREALTCGRDTARLAAEMISEGVDRGMVVMRHAARHYDPDNLLNEPFMCLTEEGRRHSFDWGRQFPATTRLNLFSSHIGRCIETAYLVDKGYLAAGGRTRGNLIEKTLSPFYVADAQRLFREYLPRPDFFSAWFNEEIPGSVIMPPGRIVSAKQAFWRQRIMEGSHSHKGWDVCVTHDWNLYLIRHVLCGISIEDQEKVDYLGGVVIFADEGRCYLTAPGQSPVRLD
ncbi:MAG: hypothetical protein ACOCPQ_01735 [Desulfosudaceae bacterium]